MPKPYPKARYGAWAGKPEGCKYKPHRCAALIFPEDGFMPGGYQCSRRNGHGDDGLFCWQHKGISNADE